MDLSIKKVQKFEVNKKVFDTEEDANKYIFKLKTDKLANLSDYGTSEFLEEMLNQGIHNKNKIKQLIKNLRSSRDDL